jgi:single-strand DNA-binding protein
MPNYNKLILVGHCTKDMEVKKVGELSIGSFGLATNRNVQKNGEWTSIPMFIDVDCFAKTAERATAYARKGAAILVEGELCMDSWVDKATGAKRSKHFVRADRVISMGKKEDAQSRDEEEPRSPARSLREDFAANF